MIKAIIFDIGGVILNLDKMKDELVKIFHPKDFDKFWERVSIIDSPLCSGEIDDKEYWDRLAREFDVDVSLKDVRYFWLDGFRDYVKVDNEMLKLIARLKGKYKIGLISNISDAHAKIVKKMGILKDFDEIIFSNEVMMAKDGTKIFKLASDRLGVDVDECIFVDDVRAFIKNAKKVGMKGVLYEGIDDLNKKLDRLKVKIY